MNISKRYLEKKIKGMVCSTYGKVYAKVDCRFTEFEKIFKKF